MNKNRHDFLIIKEMVSNNSRVLDIGCDDGSLLKMLQESKNANTRGIEISPDKRYIRSPRRCKSRFGNVSRR